MNLSLIAKVLIICLGLLGAVSSTPQLHRASDGHEYLIETELKFNWFQATHECARRGYQLAGIDSDEKNRVFIDLLEKVTDKSSVDAWLGGNDEFSSRKDYTRRFIWSATGNEFNFTNWEDSNPDNARSQEHCVHIWSKSSSYKWNDYICDKRLGFICEINHFKKTYNNDLKHKCDVFKNIASSISNELGQAHKQQLSEIDRKIQNIESLGDDWRAKIKELQITSHKTIQNILRDQKKTVKQLLDDILQPVNQLDEEIKRSTADISAQLGKKLSGKQDEINKIC